MRKNEILACAFLVSIHFYMYPKVVQSMPRRLTGVRLKQMDSSKLSSSSTSLSRNSSVSTSKMLQNDGGLPSTSALSQQSSIVEGAVGGSDPSVRPKTYSSLFSKSTSSSPGSVVSRMASIDISETESSSSGSVVVKSKSKSVVTSRDGDLGGEDRPAPISKWRAYPYQLKVGQAIFKPTFEGDKIRKDIAPRPHLVLKVEMVSSEETAVTVADMSRASGKGSKPYKWNNYMINPNDPNFFGKNSAFVKLDKIRTIHLKNSVEQKTLGGEVNQADMDKILGILGFKD